MSTTMEEKVAREGRVVEFCLMNPRHESTNMTDPDTVREFLRKHRGTRFNLYVRGRGVESGRRGSSRGATVIRSVRMFESFLKSDEYRRGVQWALDPQLSLEPSRCEADHWRNRLRG